jgi:hypothetical protein
LAQAFIYVPLEQPALHGAEQPRQGRLPRIRRRRRPRPSLFASLRRAWRAAQVYDSTISPVLTPQTQRTGPSWATGLATDRPNTREKLRSLAPTSQPAHLRTRPICKSAQRGTLILPESICRGVGYKPKPSARPRGDLYSHHPHWVAGV